MVFLHVISVNLAMELLLLIIHSMFVVLENTHKDKLIMIGLINPPKSKQDVTIALLDHGQHQVDP